MNSNKSTITKQTLTRLSYELLVQNDQLSFQSNTRHQVNTVNTGGYIPKTKSCDCLVQSQAAKNTIQVTGPNMSSYSLDHSVLAGNLIDRLDPNLDQLLLVGAIAS